MDGIGRVLVGGDFDDFIGNPSGPVVRLTSTGSMDNTFSVAPAGYDVFGTVRDLVEQPDGMILAAGLDIYSQSPPNYDKVYVGVARLSPTGTLDTAFVASTYDDVNSLLLPGDGSVWFGGKFTEINDTSQINLARVDAGGAALPSALPISASIQAGTGVAPYPDGRLIVYGGFDLFNGAPSTGLVRLLPDGTLDTTFNPRRSAGLAVLLPDGKMIVTSPLARLRADGSADAAFVPSPAVTGSSSFVRDIAVQADGKLITAGYFTATDPDKFIVRLHPSGSLDSTFNAQANGSVETVDVRADGRILMGGFFANSAALPPGIARLMPDGQLDPTFTTPAVLSPGDRVNDVRFGDGYMMMAGHFDYGIDSTWNNFAVLNETGGLDPNRNAGDFFYNNDVYKARPRRDGGFWVGGSFTKVANAENPYLVLLLPTGALDSVFLKSFQAPDAAVTGLHERANKELIITGSFSQVGGQDRLGLARYVATNQVSVGAVTTSPAGPDFPLGTNVTMTIAATALDGPVVEVQFESSTDGENFFPLRAGMPIGGNTWQASVALTTTGSFHLRAATTDSLGNRRTSYIQGPFRVFDPVTMAELTSLVLSGGGVSPDFSGGITNYTAVFPNTTTSTTLTPTVLQATSIIKVNGVTLPSGTASGAINLNVGGNTITTVVTAQDGTTTMTYTVVVTRSAPIVELTSLVPAAGVLSPAFAPGTTSYSVVVRNTTTSIVFTPTVFQVTATVQVNGVAVASGTASGPINLNVGTNTINIVVTGSDGTTTMTYMVIVTRSLLMTDALDTTGLIWSSGGNQSWYGQTLTTHDGIDAGQSGHVSNAEESWVETTVTGPGTLTFWWKVSSEANYDYLQFLTDGVEQPGSISGTVDWVQRSVSVAAGVHALRWGYKKDGSSSRGLDTGWLDEVVFTEIPVLAIADWRQRYFGSPANSGNGADLFDFDRDGLVNLVEFAMGLNPTLGSSPQLPQGRIIGTNFVISFAEPAGITGITYSAEWSATLLGGSWTPITDTGVNGQHTFSVPIGTSTGRFVRLRFTGF